MKVAHEAPTATADTQRKISELAHHTADYARAWSELFACETQLARISAQRLVTAAVWVCVLVLGVVINSNVLTAAVLNRWMQDWASSFALTLLLNLAALFGLLLAMRYWWRRLSLPRSRRALGQLLERIGNADRERERAPE
jgi:hypothetical protein